MICCSMQEKRWWGGGQTCVILVLIFPLCKLAKLVSNTLSKSQLQAWTSLLFIIYCLFICVFIVCACRFSPYHPAFLGRCPSITPISVEPGMRVSLWFLKSFQHLGAAWHVFHLKMFHGSFKGFPSCRTMVHFCVCRKTHELPFLNCPGAIFSDLRQKWKMLSKCQYKFYKTLRVFRVCSYL